jgi:hypothetical protein
MKKLKIKEKKEKKVKVSKWKIEYAKVVADVEPMLATIKTFDCNRLYWLAQHMTQQKRKCLDLDSTTQMSLKNYSKWISTFFVFASAFNASKSLNSVFNSLS